MFREVQKINVAKTCPDYGTRLEDNVHDFWMISIFYVVKRLVKKESTEVFNSLHERLSFVFFSSSLGMYVFLYEQYFLQILKSIISLNFELPERLLRVCYPLGHTMFVQTFLIFLHHTVTYNFEKNIKQLEYWSTEPRHIHEKLNLHKPP